MQMRPSLATPVRVLGFSIICNGHGQGSARDVSASAIRENLSKADVLLLPPIPETMKILDWHLGKDIAEAARIYTTQRIIENESLIEMKAA